ncbi:hypothetical protein ABZ943_40595, partial [Streptomyces rubiginosohelvolus]|uniref:hypothetical protein n=1 Tax=Streptomyces rubiginosohelvolus TaxID=67362 RepID=UPI00340945F8
NVRIPADRMIGEEGTGFATAPALTREDTGQSRFGGLVILAVLSAWKRPPAVLMLSFLTSRHLTLVRFRAGL